MGRKFTRKIKGGDLDIDAVKTTIGQLKDDVITISNDIEKLGLDLGMNENSIVLSEEIEPNNGTENGKLDSIYQENNESIDKLEIPINNIEENPISSDGTSEENLLNQKIILNDFSTNKPIEKTIKDLLKDVQRKGAEDKRDNKYKQFLAKVDTIVKNPDSKLEDFLKKWNVERFVYKNNKIFGGRKTKKNQRKSRKNNKSRK
jgi:hypothetical protein